MSNHRIEIVPVELEPHPNADSLSIVKVYGYSVCVRTADWKDIKLGAYITPDSVVPNNEQFAFLNGKTRITVKKFRGVISMGLLIPAPEGAQLWEDVSEILGITHYEPPLPTASSGGEAVKPPPGLYCPKYDVENMLRYPHLFIENETVYVTEKIHGANARFTYVEDQFYCGSKNEWKKEDDNIWWRSLNSHEWLKSYLQENSGYVVYGEVFGNVQSLKYGAKKGEYFLRVFDVFFKNQWMSPLYISSVFGKNTVPVLGYFPFDLDRLKKLAEGHSLIEGANHIREGIVVRPVEERDTREIGRLQLKLISNEYLSHA